MRHIRVFGVLAVLVSSSLLQTGCGKKQKPDRSFTPPPEKKDKSAIDRIQVRKKPRRKIDKKDVTPMGYLSVAVRSRERGKMTKSLLNLRAIGQAVEMYRATEGKYPPSFQALAKADFISSSAGRSAGDREYEIVYLPPTSKRPRSTDVLAFDPVCYPVETYAVLLIDGTSATMSLENLKRQLRRQGVK